TPRSHYDPPLTHSPTHSLHDALPISLRQDRMGFSLPRAPATARCRCRCVRQAGYRRHRADCAWLRPVSENSCCWCAVLREGCVRSEEHTSELQSRFDLVCRLLLGKKK